MDLSLDPTALARLAAPYESADGRESMGGNPAAFHLPLMDPNVSSTPDGGSAMSADGWGAGGNATPIFNQANFSFVQTPPAIVAEMMRQASQNQQLEGQRAELMLAAQKLRGEADEAFSENEEMKLQARAFINAAEAGYQTMQEQAQNQFMEMTMNHRQQIAGLEMMQGQKVSFLEMNLAQQQQASFEMQRRLAEMESIQAQLLKELRELKGRKDETPGVPEGAAEVRESIPAHEAPFTGLSQADDVRSFRTADLFGTPSMKSQPGGVFSPNATVFQPVSPWNDGYGSLAANALSGNFGRGGPGNGGGGPAGGGGDNPGGGRSSGDPMNPGRPGIPLLKIPKSGGGPPGPPGEDDDPDGDDDFEEDDDELTDGSYEEAQTGIGR